MGRRRVDIARGMSTWSGATGVVSPVGYSFLIAESLMRLLETDSTTVELGCLAGVGMSAWQCLGRDGTIRHGQTSLDRALRG